MRAEDLIKEGAARLREAKERLSRTGDEAVQATELLEAILDRKVRPGTVVGPDARRRFNRAISRRASGEPLAYITGWTEFRGMRISVARGVFVPRASSEFIAGQAIRRLRGRKGKTVAAEVACGAGPMALSMARAVPTAEVHGTDMSARAVAIAQRNATALKLRNARFHRGDMLKALPARIRGRIDVMASHPPYVPVDEVDELPDELRAFEPHMSLTDRSDDGLRLTRVLVAGAREWLRPGGWLLIEIGSTAARETRAMMTRAGFVDVASLVGDMRHDRVLVARRPRDD